MIWNDEVKQWLIANMNEYRNTNGRLSIGKLEDAVVEQFDQPMDQGEFIRWTEENDVKQCDGIKRLKKRLGKHKVSSFRQHANKKVLERLDKKHNKPFDIPSHTLSDQQLSYKDFKLDHPTKSNLETLDWNGKTYILLSDCLKLLNIK